MNCRILKHSRNHVVGDILLLCVLVFSVAPLGAAEITVFAAASLTDALKQVASGFEQQSGDRVVFNFAASSTLARQIEEGAPADVFFSADEAKMDDLEAAGQIVKDTRASRLSNALVIVVPDDSTLAVKSARDLTNAAVSRIALADTRVVPAGVYAKAYLTRLKLWPAIEPKVVPTENVRGALAAVESGNVDAGMVYRTDAAISRRVKIAFEVPRADGPKISYPVALVKEAPQPDAARKLLTYLGSDRAAAVFERFGFIVLKQAKGG